MKQQPGTSHCSSLPCPGWQSRKKSSICQTFVTFPIRWRHIWVRLALHSVMTANSLATSGLTVCNTPLFVVRGCPLAQGVPRERKHCFYHQYDLVDGEKAHPANYQGCRRRNRREHPRLQQEGSSPQTLLPQVSPLWRHFEAA